LIVHFYIIKYERSKYKNNFLFYISIVTGFLCYLWRFQDSSLQQTSMAVCNDLTNGFGKGKAIPVTGSSGSQDCETSRLPHFLDNQLTDGGEVVSLKHWPPFTLRKIPGTHSC
jgi:hypothetical protein